MTILPLFLTLLTGLIGLVWVTRHVKILRAKRHGLLLAEDNPGPPDPAPKISVVVAGKDEEDNIEACLRSLAEQDYPNFEIIACNDRSTDETGAIIDRLADENDRIRAVHIDHLPDGWKGKNHALQQGSDLATGEFFFFTDADCRQTSPRSLSVALQLLLDRKAGLLSVLPTLEMKGFWENVVQPVCSGVMMIWFDPNKVNRPESSAAYANGAFVLISRDAYDNVGRHAAIKNILQEDLALAHLVKQKQLGLVVSRSRGLYVVRMYTSLKQIVHGWTRIFFGSFPTLRRLTVSLVLIFMMGFLPYISAILGLTILTVEASPPAWWWACSIAGLATGLIQLSVIHRFYRLIHANPYFFWAYPLGCLITIWTLLLAMLKHRRGAKVTWKGTTYRSQETPGEPTSGK